MFAALYCNKEEMSSYLSSRQTKNLE